MLSIEEFLNKSEGRAKIHKNFEGRTDKELCQKAIVCIPDMHLLEKKRNDDFFDSDFFGCGFFGRGLTDLMIAARAALNVDVCA